MAESFDAVLADGREIVALRLKCRGENIADRKLEAMLARLQSAHEAEVAEVRESARHEAVAMGLLADRAVGLLRECNSVALRRGDRYGLCDAIDNSGNAYQSEQLASLLSEQAGERENGDG